jgi:glycosyltransferase involved in cell wall biosynthesis
MNSNENVETIKTGLVSIITPLYNGEKYIAETIESVLSQTYTNWEMIIINDGSTDNSVTIVENYLNDPRISLLQQKNQGSAAARNNGIRNAQGQYISLLDADDIWEPDFLDSQIAFIKEKNAILVYASRKFINEQSKEILKPVTIRPFVTYKKMLLADFIPCATGLYDRTKYGKIYFREELKSLRDDYAYWLDILKLCGIAYGNQKILAKYRVVNSSVTGNKKKLIKVQFYFYRKFLGLGFLRSIIHTFYWGIRGLNKYRKF